MIHFLTITIVSSSLIFCEEAKVQEIKLSGLITDKKQEISGMEKAFFLQMDYNKTSVSLIQKFVF